MNATKHTEGPWRVMPEEAHKDYIRVRGTRLGQTYKIANVCVIQSDSEIEEARANARLIAKAPEMWDLLRKIALGDDLDARRDATILLDSLEE